MLLCAIDVAVAGIAGHDPARDHNLDGPAEGIIDHLHGGGGHPVKRRDLLRGQRLRLGRALIIGITAKDDVQGEAARAGVLAAYDLCKILKLHLRPSRQKRAAAKRVPSE